MSTTAAPTVTATLESPAPGRAPHSGFLVAWVVFWLLMLMLSLQEHWRDGRSGWWQPLVWEGSSCLVASVLAWTQWQRAPRLDARLHRPWAWFGRALAPLPLVAPGFVALVYALRHAVYAALGLVYLHPAWITVLVQESLKFTVFYLLFVALVFGIRSHAAMNAARLRAEQALALQQGAQLLQLAQQLEPHFLFNALNTIASTVHTDPDRADALITKLAALLRAATDLARKPMSTLADELNLLEAYAAIMQQRFADRLQMRFDVDEQARGCSVPSLLLQPLLENAFRHGVERHPGPARLRLFVQRDGARLRLGVEDNLGQLDPARRDGVGLSNLRQRLAARYGDAASLQLSARAEGGVRAVVEMPG